MPQRAIDNPLEYLVDLNLHEPLAEFWALLTARGRIEDAAEVSEQYYSVLSIYPDQREGVRFRLDSQLGSGCTAF